MSDSPTLQPPRSLPPPRWTQSAHCASRAHCAECRNNRAFRASIARAGLAAEVDFPCPLGFQIQCGVIAPPPPSGPGTILKRMLASIGIASTPNCQCNRRAAEMDRLGPDWCLENIHIITGWLAEEADRRHIPFHPLPAQTLIRLAIARSRIRSNHQPSGARQIPRLRDPKGEAGGPRQSPLPHL